MGRWGALLRRGSWLLRRDDAPFARVPSGITASARTFSTKRRRLTRMGRTMRWSRGLVRPLRAPIRSLTTSKRRWAPGKGRSSGILDTHDRYLSTEERGHATEERDYAGAWSRRQDGQWAHPARHRGDRAHGRAGREQRSGPKQAKVALSGRKRVPIRRRVALVRRRTAPSGCMVAPARRIDAAIGTKCAGDASAWSRWRDEGRGHPSGWHGHTDAWLGEPVR